ncbi:MAG: hypothetical protein A3G32_05445 [Deltaproteobacteria bacterium RIFCSPLOWO2_12_FULL_40_28]|nr:MAG: hypothetical protein A3C45_09555 [Deltaproteobacteria bacterium RIFCSPHIGHO2_02_FULL_40_28]OGQ18767.1 MAG: hypothetical protein A3E27_00220 [Deltaproteobacteria bacterium RIFCSPHIGHO2_12_FULL_40_32]OGQ41074.1 MAG: hypothetical protein A3I69_04165 [Deltaproteobacteria bacterium RIFCSPLOWO2_02_FULL_40_36]OGQ54190.1 MAG: hypothetical protein A3G32_05445 [Deltaproteobacteria bacterium RIFCSPLOWO2_12_FULL_40_28]
MTLNNMIELINIKKIYKDNERECEALKGLSFKLDRGEKIAVVGPSGAGKSTLLHLMGGLDRPSAGQMFFEGKNLFSLSDKELSKYRNKTVGFIFQFHNLLSEFSALDNVSLPLLIGGESKRESVKKAQGMLERVGLGSLAHSKPNTLSGGEQQRVAIARALVGRPSLVLADEPTGNLDTANSEKVFDLLLDLNQEINMTLVVVTHNLSLTTRLERIIRLSDGKLAS